MTESATAERTIWWPSNSVQKENTDARFGDLIRYWFAGRTAKSPPDKLDAVKQALDPSVTYGNLGNADLDATIEKFSTAESKVNDRADDVYKAWDRVDAASSKLKSAETQVTLATEKVKEASSEVSAAEGRVRNAAKQSGSAAAAALGMARAALSVAVTILKTAKKGREEAKKELGVASAAPKTAETRHKEAKARRKQVDDPNDEAKQKASRKKILEALEQVETNLGKAAGTENLGEVSEALVAAHRSHADMEAWSAVFVVSCVRAGAIGQKLEIGETRAKHRGADRLLKASSGHSRYIIEARDRKKKSVNGTYHAFGPTDRNVQLGDIVCLDRADFIRAPVSLANVGQQILHCDIVTRVKMGNPGFAETIGGNVHHTVRRRCYPLDAQGRLIVSKAQLFAQENDNGKFGAWPPKALDPVPTVLPPLSTGRIFALLSLVCTPVAGAASAGSGAGSGKKERFASAGLENLESPFLDQELLQPEPENAFGLTLERLVAESPFEKFAVETLEVESRPTDADESEYSLSDQELLGSEGADELDAEAAEANDEAESALLHDEVDARHEAGLDHVSEAQSMEEEEEEATLGEEESEEAVDFEEERKDLAPADTVDELAAQLPFPAIVRDRIEALPVAKAIRDASTWNKARHPGVSGIDASAIRTRLDAYLKSAAIEKAIRDNPGLAALSTDTDAVLAVLAHQFQRKIYAPAAAKPDGKIGEGTLDALGFVRHRGDSLNAADALNVKFHVKGNSKAFKRIKDVFDSDKAAFSELGSDVAPKTWFCLFVNAPFLGHLVGKGIHLELMRRLRQAEKWLLGQPAYRNMSPVELGAALGIDEDHHGGRTKNNSSMHTLGLAIDIGYTKNPWVTGQHDHTGQLSAARNSAFQAVTRNVSRLLGGTEDVLTPRWLSSLSSDPTASAHGAIQLRHANLQTYLSLENDAVSLGAAIERQRQGARPELVIARREAIEAAVRRWRAIIRGDRAKLQQALGSRRPRDGFLNLHGDLVVALRDHGCLAWGAIDLGDRANGDMMHFDCRATGIGWKLALERQRTVGSGHPCASRTEATQELETPVSAPGPASPAAFRGGKLWTFAAKTLPIRVAVFCPKIIAAPQNVTVLVYAHGHLGPCPPVPKTMPVDLITKPPFELGKIVDASNRAIVLVVPFLDWANLTKNKLSFEACNRSSMHVLGTPAGLNGILAEVLAEVGRVFGSATPSLQSLILSGHSRAYDFLNPLALAHADPEMSRGALAALSHVWALDTTYVCFVAEWLRWLASKPGLRIEVFYRKVPGTKACGEKLEAAMAQGGGRLTVNAVSEGHCKVPGRRLPGLLKPAGPSAAPEIAEEFDDHLLDGSLNAEEMFESDIDEAPVRDTTEVEEAYRNEDARIQRDLFTEEEEQDESPNADYEEAQRQRESGHADETRVCPPSTLRNGAT